MQIWGRLARRVAPEVAQRPELYTLLPVQYPFVVPGARFREVYYWDSYFVLQGLLASNLTELAQVGATHVCCVCGRGERGVSSLAVMVRCAGPACHCPLPIAVLPR